MKKIAVFVEGYTEILFVERLILEIAGSHKVRVEQKRIRGGSTITKSTTTIKAAKPDTSEQYYVLLVDCGGDHQVQTRVLEEHNNLTINGYSMIIGLRDVRPNFTFADIPRLEIGLRKYIKTSLIPVDFILAIMEIEAWFLAEFNHYERIDHAISVKAINAALGFDPLNDDLSQRANPADDLDAAYKLGGKSYKKKNAITTINALDYANIYFNLKNRVNYLNRLIAHIDGFLA